MSTEPTSTRELRSGSSDSGKRRGFGVVVGLALLAFKLFAYGRFLSRPGVWVWLIPVGAVFSLLRARPISMTTLTAAFIALLVHPHPLAAEFALAAAAWLAIFAACLAIGLVLRWRDNRPAA